MAIIEYKYFSNILIRNTEISIVIPDNELIENCNVVYLLHGFCGDHHDWLTLGDAFNLAMKYKTILIMPNGYNSWYINHYQGFRYYDLIANEIFNKICSTFPLNKEKLYIAGLSMGGFGAMYIGLRKNIFKGIGFFSGVDTDDRNNPNYEVRHIFEHIKEEDTFKYYLKDSNRKQKLIYHYCGRKDFLYEHNLAYKKLFENACDEYIYKEDDRGHQWDAWRDCLDDYLKIINTMN